MSVSIYSDHVIKSGDCDSMYMEFKKTTLARQIAQDSGLFIVPKVLDYDASHGVLVLDRIYNYVPISELIRKRVPVHNKLLKLGQCLALVHNNLVLHPCDDRSSIPKTFAGTLPHCALHGDLNVQNVGISTHASTEKLVILDWNTSPLLSTNSTYGSPFFDICWFKVTGFSRAGISVSLNRYLLDAMQALIKGYSKESDFWGSNFWAYQRSFLREWAKLMSNQKGRMSAARTVITAALMWKLSAYRMTS